jgi:hypothetical protein
LTLAQYVEKKKAEPKTPHFLSLNQDIVAGSQEEKCGLKYVMQTSRKRAALITLHSNTEWLSYGLEKEALAHLR